MKESKNSSISKGPRELVLYPTSKCNFRCSFCLHPPDIPEMKLDVIELACRKFPSIQSVCIAGFGEPLMWEKICQAISFLKDSGKMVNVITNGSLLLENLFLLKEADQISISLNAPYCKAHSQITGSQTFDRILKGISSVRDNLKAEVGISMVVIKRKNIFQIPDFIDLGYELDVHFIDFLNLLPHREDITTEKGEREFLSKTILSSDREIISFIDRCKRKDKHSIVRTWPIALDPNNCPRNCQSPFVSLGVDSRGYVSGCRRQGPPRKENGHLKDQEVWMNTHFQDLRSRMLGEKSLLAKCRFCVGSWSG